MRVDHRHRTATSRLTPVRRLTVFPTNPISDLRFHNAKKALYAAFSKRSSPVRRLNVANSKMREPGKGVLMQVKRQVDDWLPAPAVPALYVGVKYPVDRGVTYKFRSLLLGVRQVSSGSGGG